ncbi:MAG: hypothetical protein QM758_23185 [Armatimonas sp.]
MDSLPPNQKLAAPGKWPIVGEKAPREDDSPWQLRIATGAVEQERNPIPQRLGRARHHKA